MAPDPQMAELAAALGRIERLEKAMAMPVLPYASLDDAAVLEKDEAGTVTSVWGKQHDGTHTFAPITSSVPQTPTDPFVDPRPGGLQVVWDGGFLDDDVVRMDFARVEVHASLTPGFTPSRLTIAHVFDSPQGGEAFIPRDEIPLHIKLVQRTQAGVGSLPSGEVQATPAPVKELRTAETGSRVEIGQDLYNPGGVITIYTGHVAEETPGRLYMESWGDDPDDPAVYAGGWTVLSSPEYLDKPGAPTRRSELFLSTEYPGDTGDGSRAYAVLQSPWIELDARSGSDLDGAPPNDEIGRIDFKTPHKVTVSPDADEYVGNWIARHVVVVADTTAREAYKNAYLANHAGQSQYDKVVSPSSPLFVWRVNASPGAQLEYTTDGTTWTAYGGVGSPGFPLTEYVNDSTIALNDFVSDGHFSITTTTGGTYSNFPQGEPGTSNGYLTVIAAGARYHQMYSIHHNGKTYVRAKVGAGSWNAWVELGSGGGTSDHGALSGLGDDDHTQYALADGSRGAFVRTVQGEAPDGTGNVNIFTDSGEIGIPLAAGYEYVPSTGGGYPAEARMVNGIVYLGGLIRQAGGTAFPASTVHTIVAAGGVPAGMRPSQDQWFTGGTSTGQSPVTVVVLANGAIQVRVGPTIALYAGLAQCIYPPAP